MILSLTETSLDFDLHDALGLLIATLRGAAGGLEQQQEGRLGEARAAAEATRLQALPAEAKNRIALAKLTVFLSLFKAHHCLASLFGEEPTTVAGG
jgi:hypothetical protein